MLLTTYLKEKKITPTQFATKIKLKSPKEIGKLFNTLRNAILATNGEIDIYECAFTGGGFVTQKVSKATRERFYRELETCLINKIITRKEISYLIQKCRTTIYNKIRYRSFTNVEIKTLSLYINNNK